MAKSQDVTNNYGMNEIATLNVLATQSSILVIAAIFAIS
jgi:hypothetical protein